MKKEDFIMLVKNLTPRGAGVKISKNPDLKKLLWNITSFLPENAPQSLRIWCIKEGILTKDNLPKCPVCGSLPAFSTGKFLTYCSKKCAQLDKEKFIKKYGVDHYLKLKEVKEKRKETVLRRYGVDNIGKITREKAKKTMLERYGVDNYTKTKEYKERLKEISLRKYGTTHPMKSPIVKEKLQEILNEKRKNILEKQQKVLQEKYGVNSPMKIPAVKEKVLKKYKKKVWGRLNIKFKAIDVKPLFDFETFKYYKVKERKKLLFLCKKCGAKFLDHLDNGHLPVCPVCYRSTIPEQEIVKFLKDKNITFETNNRNVLNSFEIDIFIPEKNLGIEVNGIYYHAYENLIHLRGLSKKEAKNYHRLKWILATQKNIKLLQFWDSEILNKKDIVFSIISNFLGLNQKVYAKDCKLIELTETQVLDFFFKNHIASEVVLGKSFGLVYKDKIVSAISIGKARFGLEGYEIYRFANKRYTNVIGALGKLTSHIKNYIKGNLYSYVDLRLFSGKSLETIGFEKVKITEPDYYYTKDFINLIPRQKFMKLKTGLTEKDFCKQNGYHRIFSVGNALYKLTI